jgi:hypothetical protein
MEDMTRNGQGNAATPRYGWPFFACCGSARSKMKNEVMATNVADPGAAVTDLLIMLLERSQQRSQSFTSVPPPHWKTVWRRAYAASASKWNIEGAIEVVATATLEWAALIRYAGPEKLSGEIAIEFRDWILDREHCRMPECHELWADYWLRREELISFEESVLEASDVCDARENLVMMPSDRSSRINADVIKRYQEAKSAWEFAWDVALRRLGH